MAEVKIDVPEDIAVEFGKIPQETWQLLFSRFLQRKLERMREVEAIAAKSKMTEEQAEDLADEVSLALAKRYEEISKRK